MDYYPYHPYHQALMRSQKKFMQDLEKAINGEYSAISCYKKLAQLAPDKQIKNRLNEIRNDEQRHYEEFRRLYTQLTGGGQPTPQMTEQCPASYEKGIVFAFKDEQKTVDFYLDIANQAQDPSVKEIFRRAAADEQNHAVWFLSFQMKSPGPSEDERQNTEEYGAQGAMNAATLTVPDMLIYAIQDEHLAQARYEDVLNTFGYVRTFARIKEAELRHINALNTLFARYQVPLPEDTSQLFIVTPENIKRAYGAGVRGEIDNIAMYNKFLTYALPADIRVVFTQLRDASVNHLAAFERGLERE
ncbi:Rubrerythrin [Halobacillus alkaliphilus]|uniref:Rubrerythrin n=1 Tax=Halobacillus alkaliphilus TaxID=396056 RepID=A0A1I2KB15_9BACI|nr:ferritin family protein [Halobacillus alkaliphilus]SFF64245.1 Rubrerythrin [Halobacillus alkaliphilus]